MTRYLGEDRAAGQSSRGVIGAIQVPVSYFYNSGTIDGGTASAMTFAQSGTTVPGFPSGSWNNDGSILSAGSPATLDVQTGYSSELTLYNSGTIRNAGSGSAISYNTIYKRMSLTNAAGGSISSANGTAIVSNADMSISNSGTISGAGTAIDVAGGLHLTGSGTITGSVNAGASGSAGSTIDLSAQQPGTAQSLLARVLHRGEGRPGRVRDDAA